jgi:membrane protease YdiL (CAAX protease family)
VAPAGFEPEETSTGCGDRHAGLPGPSAQAKRAARLLTWLGVFLFWVVLGVLAGPAEVPLVDAILLSVLLAAVPMLAVAQVPLVTGATIERMPAYWSSILTLWILGSACWFVGSRDGGPAALGIVAIPLAPLLLWTGGLTAAGLGLILCFRWLALRFGLTDTDLLLQLLPQTASERRVFAVLSVAAGTGEEIAYRGYAITALTPVLGLTGAAALSTVLFGVMHAYQGVLGIVRTGFMGAVLAWGFLASGSLWPPILAHTLIDILAGIVLGERLITPLEED